MSSQPAEDAQTSHVVINVIDDAEPAASRCCCVCTEPLEWVAFGRCRHLDVCVGCAIRIRFFQNKRRCCICRTYCPNVIVTHVDSRLDDLPFFSSRGRAERYYWWYHGGMGAYFNDQNQYEMATKACAMPPPRRDPEPNDFEAEITVNQQLDDDAPSQQPAAGGVVYRRNGDEPLSETCLAMIFVGIFLCVILFLTAMCGLLLFTTAETSYQKVAVGIAFGLLLAAAAIYAIWCWPKFKETLLNC